jgi:hypothetical protein
MTLHTRGWASRALAPPSVSECGSRRLGAHSKVQQFAEQTFPLNGVVTPSTATAASLTAMVQGCSGDGGDER